MATSQVSAQARGVIVVLEGKAWVLDTSGKRVLLKVGDEVQEGQIIVTDTGTRLELALPNGQAVSVSAGRELLIDANLLGLAPTDRSEAALNDLNSGSAQIARVIQSGGDLSTELDPTAAGQTGGDSSESHSFVRVLRIVENLSPLGLDRATDTTEDREPILGFTPGVAATALTSAPNAPVVASVTSDAQTEGTAL
ncbi:MAG TPA: retention module-containing protein, partial [Burkholderiaceae bacterium]|nr:retention module-containing protein [Burkholderiaceae bacterium]